MKELIANLDVSKEGAKVKEIFPIVLLLLEELEFMHAEVYKSITQPFYLNSDQISSIILAIGKKLFEKNVNFAKILSIFLVAANLSVEMVANYDTNSVEKIIDSTINSLPHEWILENGKWFGITKYVKTKQEITYFGSFIVMIIFSFMIYVPVEFVKRSAQYWNFTSTKNLN